IVPCEQKIKVVYLGRYERRKGIEELNEAIGKFVAHKKNHHLEFHFVGPIPEDKKMITQGIIYHGEVRDKTILQNILRTSDVLVCASWSEGMPNVILEGMASGLAIITTNVGASGILVDASNGWLLSEPDVEQIKQVFKAINLMKPTELDQKKAASLVKILGQFTWEKLIQRLVDTIKNIIETKH
ncbi:MAG: glycosyltransferase family 4 protein, partial [Bacteroidota bacterium]